jgi:3-methyl-2-oxobutanoate hydroxymethyltransferase
VRRGVKRAYLLADLPYHSYGTPTDALANARRFIEAGADGVKLEGGEEVCEVVQGLTAAGIEVCAHIGFTPQTLGSRGRVQGKTFEQSRLLVESAEALEAAGAMIIVLELVTEDLARVISQRLRIPTIGIGSGPHCDGQVLVVADVLGMSPNTYRLSKRYAELRATATEAISRYTQEVRERRFPTDENAWATPEDDFERLETWLHQV